MSTFDALPVPLSERIELRYVATALDATDRHRFLTQDPGNGRNAVAVKTIAAKALCEAAYHNQVHRFSRLMLVLDPKVDGPAALAQAVMANHPGAVTRLLTWGVPVEKDDVAWCQARSVNNPRVVAQIEQALVTPVHVVSRPPARRRRTP